MDKPKVQPKKEVKKVKRVSDRTMTENEKVQEWNTKRMALDEEYGLHLVVSPAWKARDDGTFSLVQQSSVGKLPKQETK